MMWRNTKLVKSVITAGLLLMSIAFMLPAAANTYGSIHVDSTDLKIRSGGVPYYNDVEYGNRRASHGKRIYFGFGFGKNRHKKSRIHLSKNIHGYSKFGHGNRYYKKRHFFGNSRSFKSGHGKFRSSRRFFH